MPPMALASSAISSPPTSPITSPPVSPRLHHPPSPYAALPPSPYANIPPSPYANFSPTPYATANIPPSPYPPTAQREQTPLQPELQPPAEPAVQLQSVSPLPDSNPHPRSIKTEPTQPKAQEATQVSNSETCASVIQDDIIEIQQQTGNITMQTTGQIHWLNKNMWHTKIRQEGVSYWKEFKRKVNSKVLIMSIAQLTIISPLKLHSIQRKTCLHNHECTLSILYFRFSQVRTAVLGGRLRASL